MSDVNTLGSQLTRGALRNRAQAGLGRREGGESFAATQGSGRAREQDRTAAARAHHARRFAPGEEAGEAGHLPHLGENSSRRLDQTEAHIGADVEDHDFESPDARFDVVEQGDHVGLDACIDAEGVRGAALSADFAGQRLELIEIAGAPGETDRMPVAGKCFGDGGPESIAGADDETNALTIRLLLHDSPRWGGHLFTTGRIFASWRMAISNTMRTTANTAPSA